MVNYLNVIFTYSLFHTQSSVSHVASVYFWSI